MAPRQRHPARRLRAVPGAAPSAPPPRPRRNAQALVAVLALAGVAALFAWPRLAPRTPFAARTAAADSAGALDGATAYGEALARVQRGQARLSLPFFERALAASNSLPPRIVLSYAAALQDAGLDPLTRTAVERHRYFARALDLLERAERTASRANAAVIEYRRAYVLRVIGLPLDTVDAIEAAIARDPSVEDYRQSRDGMIDRLRHPEDPA